jgi:hypothetical protein
VPGKGLPSLGISHTGARCGALAKRVRLSGISWFDTKPFRFSMNRTEGAADGRLDR